MFYKPAFDADRPAFRWLTIEEIQAFDRLAGLESDQSDQPQTFADAARREASDQVLVTDTERPDDDHDCTTQWGDGCAVCANDREICANEN